MSVAQHTPRYTGVLSRLLLAARAPGHHARDTALVVVVAYGSAIFFVVVLEALVRAGAYATFAPLPRKHRPDA